MGLFLLPFGLPGFRFTSSGCFCCCARASLSRVFLFLLPLGRPGLRLMCMGSSSSFFLGGLPCFFRRGWISSGSLWTWLLIGFFFRRFTSSANILKCSAKTPSPAISGLCRDWSFISLAEKSPQQSRQQTLPLSLLLYAPRWYKLSAMPTPKLSEEVIEQYPFHQEIPAMHRTCILPFNPCRSSLRRDRRTFLWGRTAFHDSGQIRSLSLPPPGSFWSGWPNALCCWRRQNTGWPRLFQDDFWRSSILQKSRIGRCRW